MVLEAIDKPFLFRHFFRPSTHDFMAPIRDTRLCFLLADGRFQLFEVGALLKAASEDMWCVVDADMSPPNNIWLIYG